MLNDNICTLTDGYKFTHAHQYPPGTEYVYSYFEARGGEFPWTLWFGIQYLLIRYFSGIVVTQEKIDKAAERVAAYFGNPELFNREGWEYILKEHGGKLPLVIKAVAEGSVIPTRNVLMTVENTDPKCWWLTNYVESLLSQVWYPSTVATISRAIKKDIWDALVRSGTATDAQVAFMLHDFGLRGSTSMESAAIGGAAHLVNFLGTDTFPATEFLMDYYEAAMPGFSIPAAEHSTITSWGKEHELDAFRNMLKQFPTGPVAVVSDSWNIWNAAKQFWGRDLKTQVLKRDGFVVIRPDSFEDIPRDLPQFLEVLAHEFEAPSNDKGYRVLPDQVRVIQGDGIKRNTVKPILEAVMDRGFSADNLAFGSGGGLLQDCNRDTSQYAFKASSIIVNGKQRDVYKQPIGMASKNSKRGRLKLVKHPQFKTATGGSEYMTVAENFTYVGPAPRENTSDGIREAADQLFEVFRDGMVMYPEKFESIRRRAAL